jgi:hypothetical protein
VKLQPRFSLVESAIATKILPGYEWSYLSFFLVARGVINEISHSQVGLHLIFLVVIRTFGLQMGLPLKFLVKVIK